MESDQEMVTFSANIVIFLLLSIFFSGLGIHHQEERWSRLAQCAKRSESLREDNAVLESKEEKKKEKRRGREGEEQERIRSRKKEKDHSSRREREEEEEEEKKSIEVQKNNKNTSG